MDTVAKPEKKTRFETRRDGAEEAVRRGGNGGETVRRQKPGVDDGMKQKRTRERARPATQPSTHAGRKHPAPSTPAARNTRPTPPARIHHPLPPMPITTPSLHHHHQRPCPPHHHHLASHHINSARPHPRARATYMISPC